MEIGIGIHGEPGRERVKMAAADEIERPLLDPIVEDLPFASGDNTLLFVNGMGGTPQIELYLAYHSRRGSTWRSAGIEVTRSLVGNYITSLEMQGMSITLLKLDDEMTELWDAPVHTAALRWGDDLNEEESVGLDHRAVAAIRAAAQTVIAEHRVELTHLDREIGDGDHGENMARGFTAVMAKLDDARRAGDPGGGAETGCHDTDLHRRRGRRAAVRHGLPAGGRRGRRRRRARRRGRGEIARGRQGRRRGPRQGRIR